MSLVAPSAKVLWRSTLVPRSPLMSPAQVVEPEPPVTSRVPPVTWTWPSTFSGVASVVVPAALETSCWPLLTTSGTVVSPLLQGNVPVPASVSVALTVKVGSPVPPPCRQTSPSFTVPLPSCTTSAPFWSVHRPVVVLLRLVPMLSVPSPLVVPLVTSTAPVIVSVGGVTAERSIVPVSSVRFWVLSSASTVTVSPDSTSARSSESGTCPQSQLDPVPQLAPADPVKWQFSLTAAAGVAASANSSPQSASVLVMPIFTSPLRGEPIRLRPGCPP